MTADAVGTRAEEFLSLQLTTPPSCLAIQHFHRRVAIQYPRFRGSLRNAVLELLRHPLRRARKLGLLRFELRLGVLVIGRWRDGAQRATQTIVANDLVHAQDARGHPIAVKTDATLVTSQLPVANWHTWLVSRQATSVG